MPSPIATILVPVDLRDTPAAILLRDGVGYDARLHLIDLWAWTQRHTQGPHAAAVIEAASGWRGRTGQLVESMLAAGWIETSGHGYLVRSWQQVLGEFSLAAPAMTVAQSESVERRRIAGRERARRFRERHKGSEANLPGRVADSVTSDVASVTSGVTSVTGNTGHICSSLGSSLSSSGTEKRPEEKTYVQQADAVTGNAPSGEDELMAALFSDMPQQEKPRTDVELVWQAYADTVPRVRLTKLRQDLIRRRLKEYSADDLCRSIRGYGKSKFHAGENERGIKYQTLELWLRDAAHVEAGWRYAEQTDGKSKSMQQRGLSGIEDAWAAYESKQ